MSNNVSLFAMYLLEIYGYNIVNAVKFAKNTLHQILSIKCI